MKRFGRLEFGDESLTQVPGSNGEQIRDAEFFYKRAMTAMLAGDFESALRNYSKSVEQNINFVDSWEGQILMLIELGEYNEAVMWADKALIVFPGNAALFAAKAVACFRNAFFDKAIAFSDNAMTKENITPNVWLARAEIMVDKKAVIAENCVEKALKIPGCDRGVVLLCAGRIFLRGKRYITANQMLSEAASLLPKSALAWFELGCVRHLGGCGDAQQAFEHCLTRRPNWKEAEKWLEKSGRIGFFGRLNIFR